MSKTSAMHKAEAPRQVRFTVFICSTSRYALMKEGKEVHDLSGETIVNMLEESGNIVVEKEILNDSASMISDAFRRFTASMSSDACIFCGGTGITSSDITIETLTPLLEKTLPGFGEIFRRLSYDEIGTGALLSRAIAGVSCGKAVFCIPGSPNAVKLCLEKLIVPEAAHVVKHAKERP